MDWNIQFDEANGFVRACQSGIFTLDDQAAFLSDIVSSPHWRFGSPLMIDYCDLTVDNIYYDEISSSSDLILTLKENLGPGKIALLCSDDAQFGLGRQFQMMAELGLGRDIGVFRDERPAIDYLTAGHNFSTI